jgi:hypothetical protein
MTVALMLYNSLLRPEGLRSFMHATFSVPSSCVFVSLFINTRVPRSFSGLAPQEGIRRTQTGDINRCRCWPEAEPASVALQHKLC